jgi:hypothetical protein
VHGRIHLLGFVKGFGRADSGAGAPQRGTGPAAMTDQTRDDRITAALLRRLLTHPYTYVGLDETFTDAGEPTRLVVDGSIDIDAVEAAFVKRIATPNPRWAHEQQSSPDEHPDPHG